MKIRKLYIALCGILFATQTMTAQQNMWMMKADGVINGVSVSSVNYSTFNVKDKWFTITNDDVDSIKNNLITATCTVGLSAGEGVKSLSITAEVGVCYSFKNNAPTVTDESLKLGTEPKSYTFSLKNLTADTTYYIRPYVKLLDTIIYGNVAEVKTLDTPEGDNTAIIHGHKFIDLGLPSGLLWAETNIGAETAADDGNYYAWGEVQPKSNYDWSTYKYGSSASNLTKYNATDKIPTLDMGDDAADANWGDAFRMPTNDEFSELLNNCNKEWTSGTTSSGSTIKGWKFTNKKNSKNSIFLPASGTYVGTSRGDYGSYGDYWSSTLATTVSNARRFIINQSRLVLDNYSRTNGCCVRPVANH